MSWEATAVLAAYAKVYNLKANIRATDHLRMIDGGLLARHRHVQSILEHEALTAKLVEFICLVYGDTLVKAGEEIDLVWASFMAGHHDDGEWREGDMVPELGYKNFTPEKKDLAEWEAMNDLLGVGQNVVRRAYDEYELRETSAARLVKVGDILELFCHNRVLLSFGYGMITYENYRQCAPETHDESLEFLRVSPAGTSIAEILEARYILRFGEMDLPPVYQMIFDSITAAVRVFPFEDYIEIRA
jgi:5'-deoxynucleotidase YfbR-like HD superfamily hydrolase